MEIKELQSWVKQLQVEKGFMKVYEEIEQTMGRTQLGYYLGALLATEPAEYIDAIKKNKGLDEELEEAADTIIRALNIFIVNGADAESILRAKMEKNFKRPYNYGHS